MDAQIRLSGGDEIAETAALWQWLRGERQLAGRIRAVTPPPGEGELGGAVELLSVALGSGGTAAVLAGSLSTWLQSRRSGVKITVTGPDGTTTTVEADNLRPDEVLPLITRVLSRENG
ncbi:hypothetical protein GCM10009760_61370 [Kitasatospora kazusensis]|uniref:Uncharacterized protein n=1 Tax=Kitasatospora kazusensis TaxID=407974 RepID=A0ABN3AB48_9ACTN